MQMSKNLSERVRHLIELHEEAIATLKLQIADRPVEPLSDPTGFPPVVGFTKVMPGLTHDDPHVDTPFVAIRYSTGCWFLNRGAGATSQALSWDSLLDWIGADAWVTIKRMNYSAINTPMRPKEFG